MTARGCKKSNLGRGETRLKALRVWQSCRIGVQSQVDSNIFHLNKHMDELKC